MGSRAAGYDAQPFARLSAALQASGIRCDTSVYLGGRRHDRHHDYSLAQHAHQPWYASPFDPQLPAPPAERRLIELPIFAYAPGRRWTFDGDEGRRFAERWPERSITTDPASSFVYRHRERIRQRLGEALERFPAVTRRAPRTVARFAATRPASDASGHDYHVLVGHSKADLDVPAIEHGMARLATGGAELVTLTEMLASAERDLDMGRSAAAPLSGQSADALSARLEAFTPLTCERLLELSPTASARWERYSWLDVDAAERPHGRGAHDCVWADRTLERCGDPQRLLESAFASLVDGGALVAAVHSDARAPERPCPEHPWRTEPGDLRSRLLRAGYSDVTIREVDLLRATGRAHPPSRDRIMLVRAWKRSRRVSPVERIDAVTRWCYDRLDPRAPSTADDAREILAGGHAWCSGAAIVLGTALRREGFEVRWVTMLAEDHPRGRGPQHVDSHEVVQVRLPDGSTCVVDPSSAIRFDAAVEDLLADPRRADTPRREDTRYRERRYDLYATSFWYSRVAHVSVRSHLEEPHHYLPAEDYRPGSRAARRAWSISPAPVRYARAAWHYGLVPLVRRHAPFARRSISSRRAWRQSLSSVTASCRCRRPA